MNLIGLFKIKRNTILCHWIWFVQITQQPMYLPNFSVMIFSPEHHWHHDDNTLRSRQCYKGIFVNKTCCIFIETPSTTISSQGAQINKNIIGPVNGLALKKPRASVWTNDGLIFWRMCDKWPRKVECWKVFHRSVLVFFSSTNAISFWYP